MTIMSIEGTLKKDNSPRFNVPPLIFITRHHVLDTAIAKSSNRLLFYSIEPPPPFYPQSHSSRTIRRKGFSTPTNFPRSPTVQQLENPVSQWRSSNRRNPLRGIAKGWRGHLINHQAPSIRFIIVWKYRELYRTSGAVIFTTGDDRTSALIAAPKGKYGER